jgi:DNA-binding CsgD family transcriptional regulator
MSNEHETPPNEPELTERQRAVIERIDRRVPIKLIAQELGVSETRINQHIRALKNIFEVASLNELVETYRASHQASADDEETLSESTYSKKQVQESLPVGHSAERVDPGEIIINDVLAIDGRARWEIDSEPKVVPGVLDGDHAVLLRLAVIVGIAFGILAAVVLMVTAAMTLSEALDGKASVPEDYYKPAD